MPPFTILIRATQARYRLPLHADRPALRKPRTDLVRSVLRFQGAGIQQRRLGRKGVVFMRIGYCPLLTQGSESSGKR